jgi:hypothetical protein
METIDPSSTTISEPDPIRLLAVSQQPGRVRRHLHACLAQFVRGVL